MAAGGPRKLSFTIFMHYWWNETIYRISVVIISINAAQSFTLLFPFYIREMIYYIISSVYFYDHT